MPARPRFLALMLLVLLSGLLPAARAWAAPARPPGALPLFTLAVPSAFAHAAPSAASDTVFSVFEGDTLAVIGQTTGRGWVWLRSAEGQLGWVPGAYGQVAGGLRQTPVLAQTQPDLSADAASAAAPGQAVRALPTGVIPEMISPRVASIYARGQALGNNPSVFAKVGDCNSENGRFLVMFDSGDYTLGPQYAYLQDTVAHFAGAWARTSVAAQSGFSPSAVLDPAWADPAVCRPGESPLACEYRLIRPSFALINLGTHSGPNFDVFEADLRQVVEFSIEQGVVPILATKADNVEGGDRINPIIRQVAADLDVPLWDFWAAASPLPGGGLHSDGIHLSYARPIFNEAWNMTQGWPWRNLTALLMLDATRRAVADVASTPRWRSR